MAETPSNAEKHPVEELIEKLRGLPAGTTYTECGEEDGALLYGGHTAGSDLGTAYRLVLDICEGFPASPQTDYALDAKHGVHVAKLEDGSLRLRLDRGSESSELVSLWLVALTVKRRGYGQEGGDLIPATHCYFVIAPNEHDAIGLVDTAPFVEPSSALEGGEALKSGRMTAIATRLPLHVMGWGLTTF